jgi:hypothetical protein
MRVTGVDACRRGWVAVTLDGAGPAVVRVEETLTGLLGPAADMNTSTVTGIDMPLGLLESGWREADRAARGLLGPRRSSVFAIPPRAVWEQASYQAAGQRCRELTGQGFSIQAWGLRAKLMEADSYRETCGHPLYEVPGQHRPAPGSAGTGHGHAGRGRRGLERRAHRGWPGHGLAPRPQRDGRGREIAIRY